VLEGTQKFIYNGKIHILEEGDCYFFDSNKPHYSRTLGDKPGKILMVFAVQKASAPGALIEVDRNKKEDVKK
jgi:mannose-6-phosphate isomerase-like protein (cupin superfamily)